MRRIIQILDGTTHEPVDAFLFDEVTEAHFLQAQDLWRPMLLRARDHFKGSGNAAAVPEHWGWNWADKIPQLRIIGFTFYAIECRGQLQGLMKVDAVAHRCQLPEQKGKELIYIAYLEAAPWNVKTVAESLGDPTAFQGIGTQLVTAAVDLSRKEGFKGRVGLHSLRQTEGFYQRIGMTAGARDSSYENLLWYELTPASARRFEFASESGENQ